MFQMFILSGNAFFSQHRIGKLTTDQNMKIKNLVFLWCSFPHKFIFMAAPSPWEIKKQQGGKNGLNYF